MEAMMPVTKFEIRSREPFDGGKAFGDVGPYERIDGVLHYAVDPQNESNSGIIDLGRAARDERGLVHFEGDVTLLQPVDPTRANGRLLADVVNRGNRTFMRYNLATADQQRRDQIPSGDGYLMEQGWTIASVGWQWDVSRSDGRLGLTAPTALDESGQPLEGWACVTYQPNAIEPHFLLSDRGHQPYSAADLDQPDAKLLVRDYPIGTRQELIRDHWRFARVEGGRMVPDATHVALDGGFEAGRIYEAVYRTNVCPVVGAGLLAFRDAASFFRYSDSEENPARGRISHAFGVGISQSGRFLREFLAAGANSDEAGRAIYDGLHVHIGGGRRGEFNHRYAQPSVIEPFGLGHRPPFAYDDTIDVRSEERLPGLLTKLRARGHAPKVIATNTGTEYWRGDASLLHVDPAGLRDLPDPPEARAYLFASTQHGSGTLPLRNTGVDGTVTTSNPLNITSYAPLFRAVITNLERWVCDGVEPPPSAVPRIADGTAVTRDRALYSFEPLRTAIDTVLSKRLWSLPRLDFGPDADAGIAQYPVVAAFSSDRYASLVSAVDADGNEVAGIRLPDIAVPVATHMGWNPRHPDTGGVDQTAGLSGSTVPFAITAAEREAKGDPRLSVEDRYRDRDDYESCVREVAGELVTAGYALERDLEVLVANAMARWDALVPVAVPS
jgi:hypothetical protein